MALFGSVSRGEDGRDSDVDVLVEFDGPVGMGFIHLARELTELLGRKVDLVSRGGIKPRYYQAIEPDLLNV
jgi:predicted nucleotidyltransferase